MVGPSQEKCHTKTLGVLYYWIAGLLAVEQTRSLLMKRNLFYETCCINIKYPCSEGGTPNPSQVRTGQRDVLQESGSWDNALRPHVEL